LIDDLITMFVAKVRVYAVVCVVCKPVSFLGAAVSQNFRHLGLTVIMLTDDCVEAIVVHIKFLKL
jgi:hypothetical protein